MKTTVKLIGLAALVAGGLSLVSGGSFAACAAIVLGFALVIL